MPLSVRFFTDDKPRLIRGTILVLVAVWLIGHAVTLFDPCMVTLAHSCATLNALFYARSPAKFQT